ncbi:glutathione S-transferase [Agrobacterium sp. TS43]|uniref:glutathione S-transferase family protein n=1 Tax=unclassified Agrobacterium TaxID=2632611 RepID=UPI00036A49B7|nr:MULTISPECIES: glutathione S-transferase family protein [unclassified Agrobacterium]EPR19301.1 glutathione S-transferase [Agrobacterium radiobacter DSM 30147]KVK49598.1 glutathione S-transferase [Agrobacterium sp. JL28]KVK49835.1 glutathione S-transferase [Agrobacterium sp. LY4]KVK62777.1 glutathione S-transferase [Agrobacterium sp. TS45]KVK67228.1 glutathione S-transferase [Agrobacterium sp. C13]
MSELIFYTNPMSRGRIARWMLEEVGVPYRTEILGFETSMKSPAYRLINPMAKVPAIKHGDTIVTEAAAICAYLADAFPGANLAPTPKARGLYYRWMFFAAGPLEMAASMKAMGFEVPKEKLRMAGCGSYADVMNTLERAVSENRFIAGDLFTAADVYVGAHIGWGLHFGTVEKRPAFLDYMAHLTDRPAYKRAAQLDEEAAKDLQATG